MLSDAQLRRQVQGQISHVLLNAPLVARPSLPGSWGVVGGGALLQLEVLSASQEERSANTCCFRPAGVGSLWDLARCISWDHPLGAVPAKGASKHLKVALVLGAD